MGVPLSSLYGVPLTREELRRRTGRVEQLLGAELFERADGSERGVRCVRLRSGAIELEVVVDRALDLAQATIGGVPVAWISPTGLSSPGLAVPAGWEPFRTFFGGLLTTCGLEHTLGPVEDDATHFHYPGRATHEFPLHGRSRPRRPAARLRHRLGARVRLLPRRRPPGARLRRVAHARARVRIALGGATIELDDVVRNDGFAPTPHMLLYHVNLGWPLLGEGAEVLAGVGEPRVATPAAEGADWRIVEAPRFPFGSRSGSTRRAPTPTASGARPSSTPTSATAGRSASSWRGATPRSRASSSGAS